MSRLANKQSPVEELLRQADHLIASQQPRAEVELHSCAVLYCAVQVYSTILCRVVLCCIGVQCHAVLCCTVLYRCTVPWRTVWVRPGGTSTLCWSSGSSSVSIRYP